MKKTAFSIIELIFVLVVMGILAVFIIPNNKRSLLDEAATQLISHIRYTQYLSMKDDTYNSKDKNWYKKRWQLVFSKSSATDNEVAYTIFADTVGGSKGDANKDEIAKNPQNKDQLLTGGYSGSNSLDITKRQFIGDKKLNLGKTYNIKEVKLSGGCKYSRIYFDYLGRPMYGDQSSLKGPYTAGTRRLISSDCNIKLTTKDNKSITIVVKPETGFSYIKY